jgi:DNA-binding PucR family transcriptional regulator
MTKRHCLALIVCLGTAASVSAWTTTTTRLLSSQSRPSGVATQLDARRDFLAAGAGGLAAVLLGTSPALAASSNDEIDYSKVQDLLQSQGSDGGRATLEVYEGRSSKRPTFLTEPTTEFSENEAKSAAFKRAQLQAKLEFATALDAMETVPSTEEALAQALDQLRYLVQKNGGLPLGITKDQVVKQVRRRKAKKYWPTAVEVAYQDLLLEILRQQSPNGSGDGEKKYL